MILDNCITNTTPIWICWMTSSLYELDLGLWDTSHIPRFPAIIDTPKSDLKLQHLSGSVFLPIFHVLDSWDGPAGQDRKATTKCQHSHLLVSSKTSCKEAVLPSDRSCMRKSQCLDKSIQSFLIGITFSYLMWHANFS